MYLRYIYETYISIKWGVRSITHELSDQDKWEERNKSDGWYHKWCDMARNKSDGCIFQNKLNWNNKIP